MSLKLNRIRTTLFDQFKIGHLILAALMFCCTAWVQGIVRKEMASYISEKEFHDYQKAHREWGDEIVRGLRNDVAEIKQNVRDIRTDMRRANASLDRVTLQMGVAAKTDIYIDPD